MGEVVDFHPSFYRDVSRQRNYLMSLENLSPQKIEELKALDRVEHRYQSLIDRQKPLTPELAEQLFNGTNIVFPQHNSEATFINFPRRTDSV